MHPSASAGPSLRFDPDVLHRARKFHRELATLSATGDVALAIRTAIVEHAGEAVGYRDTRRPGEPGFVAVPTEYGVFLLREDGDGRVVLGSMSLFAAGIAIESGEWARVETGAGSPPFKKSTPDPDRGS